MRLMFTPEGMDDEDDECRHKPRKLPEQSIQAECMRDALAAFQWSCTKKVGQLVVFKKGIYSGLKHFHKDTVFVIAEVFDPPLQSNEESFATAYGRQNDIGLLAYDVDDGALWMVMDSRFFEDWES